MIVACIALFVALGGSAVALNGQNTVQSDDLGPGAQVKAPDVAANAVKGSNIVDGGVANADLAAAARGARAYGLVDKAGNLSRSKNASITHPATGTYCIRLLGGINPAAAVLLVSPDYSFDNTSPNTAAHVEWASAGAPSCPAGKLAVRTLGFFNDPTDNDHGGGDTSADVGYLTDEGFAFVVP
jgi:hypothetical protein